MIKKEDEVIYKKLNKLNYLECQIQAQKWIDKINDKTRLEEDWENLKVIEKIVFEGQEYTLYELISRQNLLREGKVMNNCISTYANKTDEENKNMIFLSLRDSNNKSLVSMSASTYDDNYITSLESSEFINDYIKKSGTYEEDIKLFEKEHEEYVEKMKVERGKIYTIDEIKEKNNVLLGTYSLLVKNIINKLLNKNIYIVDVSYQTLNDIDFIKLDYENQNFGKEDLNVIPHYEVVMFEDLNDETYQRVSYLPENTMKKLKKIILDKPNAIPLELMKKTNWINIKGRYENIIYIKDVAYCTIEDSKINLISYSEDSLNNLTFLNNCKSIKLKFKSLNNLIIKNCENLSIKIKSVDEFVTERNSYITLIDSSIKVINIDHKDDLREKSNFLVIDMKNNITNSKRGFNEILNVFHVDTLKNEISKGVQVLNKLDIYSYVCSMYKEGKVGICANNMQEYMKQKIVINKINLVSSIKHLEVKADELYNLEINVPCNDKELLLKIFEKPDEFKELFIKELLSCNKKDYEKDFFKYTEVNIPESFYHAIQVKGAQQILEVNEKYKDNTNEINYTEIVKSHINLVKEKNVGFITNGQIEKLKIIKDMYIENMDSSRVNNSRTKLNKTFSKNLMDKVEFFLLDEKIFTDEAVEFIVELFLSPKENKLLHSQKI